MSMSAVPQATFPATAPWLSQRHSQDGSFARKMLEHAVPKPSVSVSPARCSTDVADMQLLLCMQVVAVCLSLITRTVEHFTTSSLLQSQKQEG